MNRFAEDFTVLRKRKWTGGKSTGPTFDLPRLRSLRVSDRGNPNGLRALGALLDLELHALVLVE